jgi:hypothetical protein
MHHPAFMRLALGLGMLIALTLVLTGCGGGSSAQEGEGANKIRHIPEDSQTYEGKPLPAGRYATEEFKPAMSLRLDKGWTRGRPELRDTWYIRDIENDAFWLGFYSGLKVAPTPEDIVGWLQ